MLETKDALFFGTTGPRDARIMAVGEAWGENENAAKKALQGHAGQMFNSMISSIRLSDGSFLKRDQVLCTNVVDEKPTMNHMWRFFHPHKEKRQPLRLLHPKDNVLRGLDKLYALIEEVKPTVILAMGNYPLWALTSLTGKNTNKDSLNPRYGGEGVFAPTGIGNWRGSMIHPSIPGVDPRIKLLPIYHPSFINRDMSQKAITLHDLRTRVPMALGGDWKSSSPPVIWPYPSKAQLLSKLGNILRRAEAGCEVRLVVDIETARNSFITCLGLSDQPNFALTIPFVRTGTAPGELDDYWKPEEEMEIILLLRQVLGHPKVRVIGQNFLYDSQYIQRFLLVSPNLEWDTMLAQHILFPGTPKGLDYLSSLYCKYHRYWKEDGKDWDAKGDITEHLVYNCEDIWRTWEIQEAQREVLAAQGFLPQMQRHMRVRDMALRMMTRGVRINHKKRNEEAEAIDERIHALRDKLLYVLPQSLIPSRWDKKGKLVPEKTFWPDSSAQMKVLFYEVLGLKSQRDHKTGQLTVNDAALVKLHELYPQYGLVFELIREMRSCGVFFKTFIRARVDPDLRMRCQFKVDGTETFRWASSKNAFGGGGNLQNIPSGHEEELSSLVPT